MPSEITYTTIPKVERVLRSNVQKRINFSGHIRNLGPETDSTSETTLSSVLFFDHYARQEQVTITFTDSTSYNVIAVDEGTGIRGETNLGSSDIWQDYTTAHGFVLETDKWNNRTVTAAIGDDTVVFQTEVHMSRDDLIEYMNDAEIFVDAILKQAVYQDITVALNTPVFDATSVPAEVVFATTRMAAFFIFNDVYVVNIEGLQTMEPEALASNPVINWYRQAMAVLKRYLMIYTNQDLVSVPRWLTHKPLFTSVGLKDIGVGISTPQLDIAPTTLFDDEFKDLLEPEVIIGSSDVIDDY